MNEDQNTLMETDLELRIRRLEQLHIWGMTILVFGFIGYFAFKEVKNN